MNPPQSLAHLLILGVSFVGVGFAALPMGGALQKVVMLSLCVVVLSMQLAARLPRLALRLILPMLLYVGLATLSALQTSGSLTYTLAAVQPLLVGLLLYAALISCNPAPRDLKTLGTVFLVVCGLQFLFSLVKLAVHGVDEKFLIGTMSHVAGQIGFLFPAIATPILIFLIRQSNRPSLYLLVVAMLAFGIINEKRSVVFLMPLVLLASLVASRMPPKPGTKPAGVGTWLFAIVAVLVAISVGLSAIPSLNPDETYSGSVSLSFALDYAWEYLNMDYGGSLQSSYEQAIFDENVQVGRFIVIFDILRWLINADWPTTLFGLGFGSVTPSEWLPDAEDPLFKVLGTRGAISAIGLGVLETGLVGAALLLALFVNMTVQCLRLKRRARSVVTRQWARTVLVLIGVFAYDFFFYSTTLLRTMPMPYVFFSVLASIAVADKLDQRAAQGPR